MPSHTPLPGLCFQEGLPIFDPASGGDVVYCSWFTLGSLCIHSAWCPGCNDHFVDNGLACITCSKTAHQQTFHLVLAAMTNKTGPPRPLPPWQPPTANRRTTFTNIGDVTGVAAPFVSCLLGLPFAFVSLDRSSLGPTLGRLRTVCRSCVARPGHDDYATGEKKGKERGESYHQRTQQRVLPRSKEGWKKISEKKKICASRGHASFALSPSEKHAVPTRPGPVDDAPLQAPAGLTSSSSRAQPRV